MICLLVKIQNSESELYWKLGESPAINAERVIGIQANDEELDFIVSKISTKFLDQRVSSWFGIEAKKIAILIGAAR